MHPLVGRTLAIAAKEIGVRESGGANRGRRVEEYLAAVGLPPGNPWCASLAWWAINKAALEYGNPNTLIRTGYCPYLATWGKDRDCLYAKDPQPGDLFLLYGAGTGGIRARHTGFVQAVQDGIITCIEGNTSLNGSPEGIGVFRRQRQIRSNLKYLRWIEALDPMGAADPAQPALYTLVMSGKALWELPVLDGRAYAPVRSWGEYLGFEIAWDQDDQQVRINGRPLGTEIILRDGQAFAPVRDLAVAAGLQVRVEGRQVLVTKPK